MDAFEEALRNIDVFCKVLVKKMIESERENESEDEITLEPIGKLLRKKYVIEEEIEKTPEVKHLIPLPHIEEPLIDVFEGETYVKVLIQCHCRDHKVTINKNDDGLQICLESECWKLSLPTNKLQIENIIMKCNNNEALEVEIPKLKATANYGN